MAWFLIAGMVLIGGYAYYRQRQVVTDLHARLAMKNNIIQNYQNQVADHEEDNRQSQALLSTLSLVAYDIVLVLDGDGVIITLNHSANLFFKDRYPIGEKLSDVIDSADLDDIVQRAQDEMGNFEEQIQINDEFYRARSGVMRYEDAVFIGVALQDITRLVQLNRARRDMVANISHELRTPIANIRLIIDSLFHEKERPKRKDSIASLKDIGRETDALLWLAQELLDLSMIESGQAIMKLVDTALKTVVEDSIERVEDQLAAKDLRIVNHVPAKMNVLCDPDQTRRVFVNLIHNAIKWSPLGEAITVNAVIDNDDVVISVFDNGEGVPDDQLERIFERFYQVDASRSGQEGTGLGLAICKHIVEAQGGRIWAEGNGDGVGGRFLFTLLLSETKPQVDAEAESSEVLTSL